MPGVKTYNPSRVLIIMNGVPLSGYADGTFVNITQQNDGITTTVGADGEIARAVNTDQTLHCYCYSSADQSWQSCTIRHV